MEAMKENFSELNIGNTAESVQAFLDSQKELFHGQIDQFQNIVVTQCKLTRVNPLSQEMAAGALSIKIGKKPRDLLNPKAVNYMQSIFSVKDAISKKESREISAMFGVTVTQVRDFFASQRTRVRKVVRLSREKAIKPITCREPQNGLLPIMDHVANTDRIASLEEDPVPLPSNICALTSAEEIHVSQNNVALASMEEAPVPLSSFGPTSFEGNPVPLSTLPPDGVDVDPSCSRLDESLLGIDGPDKDFVENIFDLMRTEETFSGQVKLMEWILQIQNSAVLNWFLTNGIMILATWLGEAEIEEQTSVLFSILEVLCHLPLNKALPVHMAAILKSVNRLRFYRIADVSNRARVLVSRWTKEFARSQAMKKPNGVKSTMDLQKDNLLKQSISEVMADESWQSKINTPEDSSAPSLENSENVRNTEHQKPLKLLPAPGDDLITNKIRDTRGRRKVLMVEQPGQKSTGRSPQVMRVSQGRPMSADDIQKAKLRAQYMQRKHGKVGSSNVINENKIEGSIKPMTNHAKNGNKTATKTMSNHAKISLLASKVNLRPQVDEPRKPVALPVNQQRASYQPNLSLRPNESLFDKCRRVKIPWHTPPEISMNKEYGVCTGENSKEVEIQKNRNHREKETIYQKNHEIPLNPKGPWDIEMDYDDSLTPQIPTDQPPDLDLPVSPTPDYENRSTVTSGAVSSQTTGSGSNAAGPDLELLAALLKNPELVFALTSGQTGNMSNEDTVRLLDMIKNNGGGLFGTGSGTNRETMAEERVEVSLPSPTPSSNPGTSGWRPEAVNNPFSKRMAIANTNAAIPTPVPVNHHHRVSTSVTTAQQIPHYQQSSPQHFHPSITQKPPLTITPPEYQTTPSNPILHSPTPSQEKYNPQPSDIPEASHMMNHTYNRQEVPVASHITNHPYNRHVVNSGPTFDPNPWRGQHSFGSDSHSHSQMDHNGYNSSFGRPGLVPRSFQRGPDPAKERNEYVNEDEFQHWNSENIYNNRAQAKIPGWNYSESRMNVSQNPTPTNYPNSFGYQGNRRWPDHDNNGGR